MYGFSDKKVPDSYTPISWQDKLERIPADYGIPERQYSTPVPKSDEIETALEWQRMHDEDAQNDLIEPIY